MDTRYTGSDIKAAYAPPAPSQQTRLDVACNTLLDKCDTIDCLLKDLQSRINPVLVNLPRTNPSQTLEKQSAQDIQCEVIQRMGNFADRLQGIISNISGIIENVNI